MTILHIALSLAILEIILHFYKLNIKDPQQSTLIINTMLGINIFLVFIFLQLYLKKQQPIYLVPIILTVFNYFSYGHVIKSKLKDVGDMWSVLGGLEVGILGMHLSMY